MNWLFPGFLGGAALVALPVVLHLLRRKPRHVIRFPSLRFLGVSAMRDTRRNRLLRLLTLLLRCLAIALLCAAFARPFWGKSAAMARRAVVIALDNSMSQQATGRWADTERWCASQLDELRPGDQAALLVMQPEPTWAVPMTEDLARVRTVLADLKPGYDKTRYARPLRMAAETLAKTSAETKVVAWAADEQRAGWRGVDLGEKLPPGVNFRFMGIATSPQRQAAIVAVRRSPEGNNVLEVTVREFAQTPERRQLTVFAGAAQIATQSTVLRPGDNKVKITCEWPANAPGLRVALDPDDLTADDTAWIAAAETSTNAVLLDAAPQSDFIAHALRATQKVGNAGFEPASLPDHAWPLSSPVVLRNEASFQNAALARLNQFYDAGGAVWIFVDGSLAQKEWLKQHSIRITKRPATDEAWHLRDWDSDHPALSAFAEQSLLPLLEVEFYQGFDITGDTLISVANWPDRKMAVAALDNNGHRLFIAGFSLDREATDWPAKPSFVPFVHCAARWLGSVEELRNDWRIGDAIPLPDNQGTWSSLDGPAAPGPLTVNGSVRPTEPGLYEFTGRGVKKIFAVNTPVEESDLSPWPNPNQLTALESQEPAQTHTTATAAALAQTENRQRLWWWLLAVGGGALLMELALANRTKL